MRVLVTGASGRVGGRIVARLAHEDVRVRALLRRPDSAGSPHVEVALGDFTDRESLRAAFEGVDKVFMVCLAQPAPRRLIAHRNVIEAAATARVSHLVYLSFLDPSLEASFPQARWHAMTEADIDASGVPWTFLRSGLYQSSLLGAAGVIDGDRLLAPAGQGHAAPVTWQDVADVAAAVLLGSSHQGRAYDVTGAERLTWTDVATAVGHARRQPLSYEDIPSEEFAVLLTRAGLAEDLIDGMVGLFDTIRSGRLDVMSRTVQDLTGAPPVTVSQTFAELDLTPPTAR